MSAAAPLHAKMAEAAAAAPKGLAGFDVSEVRGNYAAPPYLLKNAILRGELIFLFGDSGAMKSFTGVDVAMHLGMGLDWCGMKSRRSGILYICGEGGTGIRKRIRAWMIAHDLLEADDQPDVFVATEAADLIGNPGQLEDTVVEASRRLGRSIDLVVLDTLSANFGEGDESRTEDVHRVLRNIQAACKGAAVLVVHHVGHADKTRERGAYALRAAADRRWLVERPDPGDLIAVKFLKAKDEALADSVALRWKAVPLGWFDEDGDELTSVVLEFGGDSLPKSQHVVTGKVQKLVLAALQAAGGLGKSNLVAVLVAQKVPKRSIYDAIESLIRDGFIAEVLNKLMVVES